jgi:hypothetical protein
VDEKESESVSIRGIRGLFSGQEIRRLASLNLLISNLTLLQKAKVNHKEHREHRDFHSISL